MANYSARLIRTGNVIRAIGPRGSGKTTLLLAERDRLEAAGKDVIYTNECTAAALQQLKRTKPRATIIIDGEHFFAGEA